MATVEDVGHRSGRGRGPLLCAAVIPVAVLLSLPWRDHALPVMPATVSIWVALLVVFHVLTAALLLSRYQRGGSVRLLVLAAAFLLSGALAFEVALAVPGILRATPTFAQGPDQLYWIWLFRHLLTPILLGLALAPWPRRRGGRGLLDARAALGGPAARRAGRRGPVVIATWLLVGLAAVVIALLVRRPGPLPDVVSIGSDGAAHLGTPVAVLVALVNVAGVTAAAVGVAKRRERHGLEAWAIVASVAFLGDVALTIAGEPRFTVAYYLARLLGLLSGAFVLLAIVHEGADLETRARRTARRLEEQNAALIESQRLRNHVAAVVSHDLRTPLAGLQGYLEILLNDADDLAQPLVRRMHERAWMLTRRLTLLTEDLLAASTLEHADLVVSPEPLDLAGQLAECAQVFPDLDLRITCPAGVQVSADPLRLQQILANLVGNAQKHGAEPVSIRAVPGESGTEVTLTVSDAGPGVPASFVPRLFDRYSQAVTAGGGSGLGLSVVRDLVQAHGGTIRYDEQRHGFEVVLPTGRARRLSAPADHADAADLADRSDQATASAHGSDDPVAPPPTFAR